MVQSEGWDQVVKPYLWDKLNQSFPDLSKFTNDEEFLYAAKTTSIFKKVLSEILGWFDQQVEQAKFLKKKEKGELQDPFEIGRR